MHRIQYVPLLFLALVFISSCTTSKSWIIPSQNELPSLYLGEVLVDKASGWISIEREVRDMVPLLFSDYGYPFILNDTGADYIVDVKAVEREYMSGWRSQRSIAIEIQIYENSGIDEYQHTVPVIVGKTTSSGNASLASSNDLQKLLKSGIKKIVKSFEELKAS